MQKTVLITGSTSGIGLGIAREFAKTKNYNIIFNGLESNGQEIADNVGKEFGIEVMFSNANMLKPEELQKMVGDGITKFGKIDVLINNAGIGVFPLLGEITEADLMSIYTTNVFGLTLLTQEFVPQFKLQQSGNIINIGSTASLNGFARGTVYAASKFAVRGITQSWQAELRRDNIRVTLINPSEVTTAFANTERIEKTEEVKKLAADEIAHAILSVLEMRNKGFVPELTVWATNPF